MMTCQLNSAKEKIVDMETWINDICQASKGAHTKWENY